MHAIVFVQYYSFFVLVCVPSCWSVAYWFLFSFPLGIDVIDDTML